MTFIFYSDHVPPGRYWNAVDEAGDLAGICVLVKERKGEASIEDCRTLDSAKGPTSGSPMTPPPPVVEGVGKRWDRIDESLARIAAAVEKLMPKPRDASNYPGSVMDDFDES